MTAAWTLTVRADANRAIGHGHLMRTLAIAEAVQDLGHAEVRYFVAPGTYVRPLEERGFSFRVVPVGPAEAWVPDVSPDDGPVLLDSYEIREADLDHLRAQGFAVALFDDGSRLSSYNAGLVVDASPRAAALAFKGAPDTIFLLGATYFPVRRAIRDAATPADVPERVRRACVTLGGSDPDDATALIVEAIAAFGQIPETTVILGASYQGRVSEGQLGTIRVVRSPKEYPSLIANADLVITAAGGSALECAALGRPMVTVELTPDQRPNSRALAQAEAAVSLGERDGIDIVKLCGVLSGICFDRQLRAALGANARRLVDGGGSRRIAGAIDSLWQRHSACPRSEVHN